MPTRTHWLNLLFLAVLISLPLVLLTAFFQNNTLALFPTHGYASGFVQRAGYGLPFAFREVIALIDTSSTHFHWEYFLLNTCIMAAMVVTLLHLMTSLRLSPPRRRKPH
jgi:hypothetical protein